MPDHLYSLGGGETAWDEPADVYEHEIAPHGDTQTRIIEKWTAVTAHRYLPRVDDTIERAVEYGADEMGTDGSADAWSDAGQVPEVVAAFRAALDLLARHVNYSMCGEKVGEHVLTYDAAGEPLLDGEPMYRTREPEPTTVTSGAMAVELPGVEPDKVVDLMAALERSVAEAKAARKRHPQPARCSCPPTERGRIGGTAYAMTDPDCPVHGGG
jgi:hypothetical protein